MCGHFNALLYAKYGPARVLRDIPVDDNDGTLGGQYRAVPGSDACTGWGAPDGAKLLAAMKAWGARAASTAVGVRLTGPAVASTVHRSLPGA